LKTNSGVRTPVRGLSVNLSTIQKVKIGDRIQVCLGQKPLTIQVVALNEVTTKAAELKSEYNDLKQEERALQNRYNTTLDLKSIESTAKSEYGMISPDSSQIVYLELSRQDKVEILTPSGPFDSFVEKISGFAAAVREYFK